MRKIRILLLLIVGLFVAIYILGTIPRESKIFKNIVFSYLERKLEKEISADSLKIAFLRNIEVSNLKVSDEKGFSFSAQKIKFDYSLPKLFSGGLFGRCEAKDVRLWRKNLVSLKPLLELFLISHPRGDLRFQNVYADIYLENNTFIPKNLKAIGRDIKVYGDGSVSRDEIIDYRLKFLIPHRAQVASGSTTRALWDSSTLNIFDIFKKLISPDEKNGWISLSFRIKGRRDKLLVTPTLEGIGTKN